MNFSDFITHSGKRINKEHFVHLVQVSKADGVIKQVELDLLHREGKKFGLSDPEIDKLIENEGRHSYVPPYSLQDKFDQLYNIAAMIMADETMTEGEEKVIKRYAIEAGFNDKTIPKLIDLLITGIKKGDDGETLLKEFKKKHLTLG